MNILLLGAPGVGKGTQAEFLSKRFKIPVISIGNILRDMSRTENLFSKDIREYMQQGKLVPDDIVVRVLKDRIAADDCLRGYILDGFPRNIIQAKCLDEMNIFLDMVIKIELSDEKILDRIFGRRVCSRCGESYHIEYKKPETEGECDSCGGSLIIRKDDSLDVVKNRLQVFRETAQSLENYYKKSGRFKVVSGEASIEEVRRCIILALGEKVDDLS